MPTPNIFRPRFRAKVSSSAKKIVSLSSNGSRIRNTASPKASRDQWAAAVTPEQQRQAYEANPRIGNLFAAEWYAAKTDADRSAAVNRWGIVAESEPAKAGIHKKETQCQD